MATVAAWSRSSHAFALGEALFSGGTRFVDSYASLSSRCGSRLTLAAAMAPDLGVAPPATSLPTLAPLPRLGAGSLQDAVAAATCGGSGVWSQPDVFPLAPSAQSHDYHLLGEKGRRLLGAAAGAAGYRVIGLGVAVGGIALGIEELDSVFFKDGSKSDCYDCKPTESSCSGSKGCSCGKGPGGGGNRNDEDQARYDLILKLVAELCIEGAVESKESRSKFQQLKFLMQREWCRLHKKREELKCIAINVEVEQTQNQADKEDVKRQLMRIEEDLVALLSLQDELNLKDADLKKGAASLDAERSIFKEERAELDEQLAEAALKEQKADELLYRATLDGKTVKDLYKDLQSAQNGPGKAGAAGDDNDGSAASKEEQWKDDTSFWSKLESVWSKVDSLMSYPAKAGKTVEWLGAGYVVGSYVFWTAKEVPYMDRSRFIEVLDKGIDKAKQKHDTSQAKVKKVLVEWGVRRDASEENDLAAE